MKQDKKNQILMRSISGIRGIVGTSLTPLVVSKYVNAFVQTIQAKKIVIGRDSRPTGLVIQNLVGNVLCSMGVDVIILDICTTPTVEMMVSHCEANGGIIITASHNSIEWNALKFLDQEGIFLNQEAIQRLFEIVDSENFVWKSYLDFKIPTSFKDSDNVHIDAILALPYINQKQIEKQKIRVAYDAVNGAGYKIIPNLLHSLGCSVFEVHTTPNGLFPRGAEPTEENLKDLKELVLENNCALGFATDPDGDRCALVDEKGQAIGEENTLALVVDFILKNKKSPVVVNLSTSFSNREIAKRNKVDFFQSPVGESHVIEMMKLKKSFIGGEGNGGVILPELHYGRDGVLAVALLLQAFVKEEKTLSEWVYSSIPKYIIGKYRIPVDSNFKEWILKIKNHFSDAIINIEDGLHLSWENKWIHIRKSNTEPIVRIYIEAKTEGEVNHLIQKVKEI